MKKLLSVLLASATAVTACAGLAACEDPDPRTELVIWCPSAAIACYTALGEEFVTTYKDGLYKDYKVTCIAHEEGNAETDLGTDLTTGGDVYFTEGGQIARLVDKGYILPLADDYASYGTTVKKDNIEDSLPTATVGDKLYAFPATADNTWFFWYDKNFYSEDDIKTFDGVFKKAKEENMNIMFPYNNGWYVTAWFMTAGLKMDYVDDNGTKKYQFDVAGDNAKALAAAESLHKYVSTQEEGLMKNGKDPVIIGGDNATIPNGAKAGTLVAGFMGSWISSEVPSNIVPAAKAPTINIGGEEKEMVNFFTYKYCAVNPGRKNVDVAVELAAFITGEKGQAARAKATGSAPTNIKASNSEEVKNSPIALALSDRRDHNYLQESHTSGFWSSWESFGNDLRKKEGATTKEGLKAALDTLHTNVLKGETEYKPAA